MLRSRNFGGVWISLESESGRQESVCLVFLLNPSGCYRGSNMHRAEGRRCCGWGRVRRRRRRRSEDEKTAAEKQATADQGAAVVVLSWWPQNIGNISAAAAQWRSFGGKQGRGMRGGRGRKGGKEESAASILLPSFHYLSIHFPFLQSIPPSSSIYPSFSPLSIHPSIN